MERCNLNLWQLAGYGENCCEQFYLIFHTGSDHKEISPPRLEISDFFGKNWRDLFLQIGLLNESLIGENWAQYLLTNLLNQKYFSKKFPSIFADDQCGKKPYSQLPTRRELGKTTIKSWQKAQTISQDFCHNSIPTGNIAMSRFISLLRPGTISTHPFSVTVELGSSLWLTVRSANLWTAPLFLWGTMAQYGTMLPKIDRKQEGLGKILLDLLNCMIRSNLSIPQRLSCKWYRTDRSTFISNLCLNFLQTT